MGSVVYITLLMGVLLIPLGVIKGGIQRLFWGGSIWYSILYNIGLMVATYLMICCGGYYFSNRYIVPYPFSFFINILFVSATILVLIILDLLLIKANASRGFFAFNNKEKRKHLDFKLGLVLFIFWGGMWGVGIMPLFANPYAIKIMKNRPSEEILEFFRNENRNFETHFSSEYQGKKIEINSYPYGGMRIRIGKRIHTLNYQTFFYRWKPVCFAVDATRGLVLFKMNTELFLYHIKNDEIYFLDTGKPK